MHESFLECPDMTHYSDNQYGDGEGEFVPLDGRTCMLRNEGSGENEYGCFADGDLNHRCIEQYKITDGNMLLFNSNRCM